MLDLEAHGLVAPAHRPKIPGIPETIPDLLAARALEHTDREALVGRSARLSYAACEEASSRAAGALARLGVSPGDRVATSLPNDVDVVVAFLACMRLGAVWLGINRPLAPAEKTYMLRDSGARVFIAEQSVADPIRAESESLPELQRIVSVDPGSSECEWKALWTAATAAPPLAELDPFAPAALAYTGGTTGFPKGVVHSQHNLLLPAAVLLQRGEYSEEERIGVVLPLTIMNLMVLGPVVSFLLGGTCVAIDRVDPVGLAEWIRTERVTAISTVPAILHDLLTHPDVRDEALATLTRPGVGGADCPPAFRELYEKRFGRRVAFAYGLSEAPTAVTTTDPNDPAPRGTGQSLPHVRIVICDDRGRALPPGEDGEVCIAPATEGPFAGVYTPMLGYWNRPEATAEALRDGLLHTGDIGALDESGSLFIKDRRNDLIIRGGANVYPAEVERILHEDPRVAACAVIGRPDERLGERVIAFVEKVPGPSVTAEELQERCKRELARYKVPEEVLFVATFPRTPMGKIRKTELRKLLGAE